MSSSKSHRIRYSAYALDSTGYGEFSRYIIAALHQAGHEISVNLLHDRTESGERFGAKGLLVESLLERRLSDPPTVNIVNSLPHSFDECRIGGAVNLGFTMFEAETLSESSVVSCNLMDGICVPSLLNKRVYEACGVTVPVSVVHPSMRSLPAPQEPGDRPYTFFSAFEWGHAHKDPLSLLTAYYQEFSAEEPVLLRVKTFDRGKDAIVPQVQALKDRLGARLYPKVSFVVGSLSHDEMWAAYRQSDAYVSSHHGEGWGMPIWEAMACGLPVIATGYGANMEYMTPENSYPVGYSHRRGKWADVDVRDLRSKMRRAYENRAEAIEVGKRARETIRVDFTPERTAAMLEAAIEAHL